MKILKHMTILILFLEDITDLRNQYFRDTGIGISNIFQIKEFDERWDNDLIVGSENMSLYRVRVEDGKTYLQKEFGLVKEFVIFHLIIKIFFYGLMIKNNLT